MWEAIRSNQRRSTVLIIMMGVILVALGATIGLFVDPRAGGAFGAVGALALWFFLYLIAIFQGDSILLGVSGAVRIKEKFEAPQLWNIVEEMTIASGLKKMPAIYIINTDALNAFAVGRRPEKAAVAVTSGLMKKLSRDELQGVVAHEIGHIKNLDIKFMTMAAVMMGSIVMISDVFLRSLWYGSMMGGRRRSRSNNDGGAQLIVMLAALILAILAPILAQMLYFACSRQREYLADASGALFTRYPNGLASALEKISGGTIAAKQVNRTLAPMYIINPLQAHSSAVGLFSTHPPTKKRIDILRSMSGAGLREYERAYQESLGTKRGCIGERSLHEAEEVGVRESSVKPSSKKKGLEQIREINDLFARVDGLLPIACVCGMQLKIPQEYKKDQVACPRCGVAHEVPKAKPGAAKQSQTYQRSGGGWQSFRCQCGKTVQLSPKFSGESINCQGCGDSIKIESGAQRRKTSKRGDA
ncbi:MAG: M48 family metallopeptidase [Candidatus Hinthialibacter antarcticus]|nr:M48 family metallopeptidase [Candidatus Hinthialibacter antarcticus]